MNPQPPQTPPAMTHAQPAVNSTQQDAIQAAAPVAPHLPLALQQPAAEAAGPSAAAPSQATIRNDALLSELDKEWVDKARAVVEQTKDDPYKQSREIGKLRAEYLRVRFDKQIKVVEDQSK